MIVVRHMYKGELFRSHDVSVDIDIVLKYT